MERVFIGALMVTYGAASSRKREQCGAPDGRNRKCGTEFFNM